MQQYKHKAIKQKDLSVKTKWSNTLKQFYISFAQTGYNTASDSE